MFGLLPNDIAIEHILLKMPVISAVFLLQVNRKFRKIDENPNFWKAMLKTHLLDQYETLLDDGDKTNLTPDYKRAFKNFFTSKYTDKLYDVCIRVPDNISTDPTNNPIEFFEELTTIFNKNINKTNPGPHIHITPEGRLLPSITFSGFFANFKLALPISFKLIYDKFNSGVIYYPGESISCANIISCQQHSLPIKNPLRKRELEPVKILSLAEVKLLLKAVCDQTKKQKKFKIAEKNLGGLMYKNVFGKLKTIIELNNELCQAIENSSNILTLMSEVHRINQEAVSIEINKFVKSLNKFFIAIGIKNYDRHDNKDIFLKKCQTANLISTVPLNEIKSAHALAPRTNFKLG